MKKTESSAPSQSVTTRTKNRSKSSTPEAAGLTPRKKTPQSTKPPTEIGVFIKKCLKGRKKTQKDLADVLGISRTSLWRFLVGEERSEFSDQQLKDLCDFLWSSQEDMNRRKFIKMLGDAGLFVSLPIASVEQVITAPPVLRYQKVDLDGYESAIEGWSAAMHSNHNPQATLQAAEKLHRTLRGMELPAHDERFARVRLRGGMLLATLQETVLPWYDRTGTAIATYSELERDIFRLMPRSMMRNTFAEEHLRLMTHRAILFRENAHFGSANVDFGRGMDSLAMVFDPCLRVAFRCQKLHTLAVMNDVIGWQRELIRVREYAEQQRATTEQKREIDTMIDYIESRAYKRFAWNARGSAALSHKRTAYAEQSTAVINRMLQVPDGSKAVHGANLQHAGISEEQAKLQLEVSKLEVSVWLDAQEAIAYGARLRSQAETFYPSLIKKIEASMRFAGLIITNPDASRASDHLGFVR
jgi:transcriptional regulator with XRE-family HTH domain